MTQQAIEIDERRALAQKTKWGDLERAAIIYHNRTGKTIAPNYLTKFLNGHREGSASIHRKHMPLDMYAAIAEAIAERQTQANQTNQKAQQLRKLIETITTDTKPKPIPL